MKVLTCALWDLDNSIINAEGEKLSREKQMLLCYTFIRRRQRTRAWRPLKLFDKTCVLKLNACFFY